MKPGRTHYGLVAGVAVLVVVADQLTKWWVLANLEPGVPRPVVWTLQLNLQRNSGAAFSVAAGTGFGRWVPLIALGVVGLLLWQGRTVTSRLGAVALGLVAGGALGNAVDRIFRTDGGGVFSGRVVDFLDLQWWPVFNVADMGIVVGCILLVVVTLFSPPVDDEVPPVDDPTGSASSSRPVDAAAEVDGVDAEDDRARP